VAQRTRLDQLLAADPELAVVWAVKELVAQLLTTRTAAQFTAEWNRLRAAVNASDLPEPAALLATLTRWKTEIRTFCLTRVTNAKTEAANLNAKNIKRRRTRLHQPPQLPGPYPPQRDRPERGVNTRPRSSTKSPQTPVRVRVLRREEGRCYFQELPVHPQLGHLTA
jgi:hypothetical protein